MLWFWYKKSKLISEIFPRFKPFFTISQVLHHFFMPFFPHSPYTRFFNRYNVILPQPGMEFQNIKLKTLFKTLSTNHTITSHILTMHLGLNHTMTSHILTIHLGLNHTMTSHILTTHLWLNHTMTSHILTMYLGLNHTMTSHILTMHLGLNHTMISHILTCTWN